MTHKDRLVTIGTVEPAPAGAGYGMVHLREIHHIDAPKGTHSAFWHAFTSPDEQRAFEAVRSLACHDLAIVTMRIERHRRAEHTSWLPFTHRQQARLKRLFAPHTHKEPPSRCPTRH